MLAAFALLVALRLHGFSLAAWHAVIDGGPPTEILFGKPRPIRSDDWQVQLPLLLAQEAVTPRFPVVNPVVALGQDMRLPVETPTSHWSTLFRPLEWGFFIGPDVGISWLWWGRVLGLFGVWLAVLTVVARGRLGIAATGSALLLVSPFFQFWSLNAAPHAICAGSVFLALVALARAQTPRRILLAASALALSGAWFALTLYPPYQVTLGWLVVALTVGWAVDQRKVLPTARHARLRGIAGGTAGVVAIAITLAFALDAREAIETMRGTIYPGGRISTGAARSLAELLNANLGAPFWAERWGQFSNICEAASFWLLSPVALAWLGWRRLQGERIDPLAASLAIYVALLSAYIVIGFPEWLARATGLGLVPGKRAVIGLGVADGILLVRFAARATPLRVGEREPAIAIAALWVTALAAAAVPLSRALPDARLGVLLAFAAGNGLVAAAFLWTPRRALVALALVSGASSLWFNPLAVGGTDYLRENPLARKILEIDRAEGGRSVWISIGRADLPNLFRALGVRSLGGVHPLPQLALWRRLDPSGSQLPVYNRYAHVGFALGYMSEPRFELESLDLMVVHVDPRSAAFRALGVTHVLVHPEDASKFERRTGFELMAVVGPNHFYRVPR